MNGYSEWCFYAILLQVRLLHSYQVRPAVPTLTTFAHSTPTASSSSTTLLITAATLWFNPLDMSGFLDLPPELRLYVYQHVMITCIADGSPSDAAGMLFTCRTVYIEMRAHYIPAVKMILETASKWIADHPSKPLKIDLCPDYDFRQTPTEATISFPSAPEVDDEPGYALAIAHLQLLLSKPWNSLILNIYGGPDTYENDDPKWERDYRTFRVIMATIAKMNWMGRTAMGPHYFSRTKRLILHIGARMSHHVAAQIASTVYDRLTILLFVQNQEGARWVSKEGDGQEESWKFGFDFQTLE